MSFHKNRYFGPAVSLALFAVMFEFGSGGVTWFWARQPIVAVILAGTSAVFWALLFAAQRRQPHP